MRVAIGEGCTGHGRCYTLAPQVYTSDSDGYNAEIRAAVDVPPGEEEAARLGARMCPERAIAILAE